VPAGVAIILGNYRLFPLAQLDLLWPQQFPSLLLLLLPPTAPLEASPIPAPSPSSFQKYTLLETLPPVEGDF